MSVAQVSAILLNPWVLLGFFGQFVFFLRFIVQWLTSEKKRQVVIPMSFWWISIAGSLIILVYSIHIKDIVFITAQILSLFIYVRNMMLQSRYDSQDDTTSASVRNVPS
jgi:lipid-A-disaccharide synthase-like uncharacterized protein